MSSCWTMSPNVRRQRAEAVGLEPTSGMFPPPVFKTGSSSSRMTSVNNAAGVGIEPTPPGSEPSIATSSDYPAISICRMTRCSTNSSRNAGAGIEPAPPGSKPSIAANSDYPAMKEGGVGIEPTQGCLTNTCSAAELPTHSKVPCGNRTRLFSLEG